MRRDGWSAHSTHAQRFYGDPLRCRIGAMSHGLALSRPAVRRSKAVTVRPRARTPVAPRSIRHPDAKPNLRLARRRARGALDAARTNCLYSVQRHPSSAPRPPSVALRPTAMPLPELVVRGVAHTAGDSYEYGRCILTVVAGSLADPRNQVSRSHTQCVRNSPPATHRYKC